jgi:integrase
MTGLRVSELTSLRLQDVILKRPGAHCRVIGKGRKTRTASLTPETIAILHEWLRERKGDPAKGSRRNY